MAENAKNVKAEDSFGGNWRERDKWSSAATGHFDVIQAKHNNIGETDTRMDTAIDALVEDLYAYNDHPEIAALLKPVEGLIHIVRTAEVKEVLRAYGRNDIIYVPLERHRDWPTAIQMSPELGLVGSGAGMPVCEFLRWYKGGDKVPCAVLEEWTGVPRQALSNVYWTLVDFFRTDIIQMHRAATHQS